MTQSLGTLLRLRIKKMGAQKKEPASGPPAALPAAKQSPKQWVTCREMPRLNRQSPG